MAMLTLSPATANGRMFGKLLVVVVLMFGFGYALVPMYRAICDALGINVLSVAEQRIQGKGGVQAASGNSQIDTSRTITVEFDANARGPWDFKPAVRSLQVHPGELTTVMYEFKNVQNRTMAAQAIPSYAPRQASPHFNKLECFCFNEYTLAPGESRSWPVVFVIDPKLPHDVNTITLSYTFFEVGGKVPAAPAGKGKPA
jgi:cytochrome c oxidase assembly protein subunit 11